jgi:hypothetical protein
MWMSQVRVRVRVGANNSQLLSKPSMASLSPISFTYPKPTPSLISLVFSHRRSLSTATWSQRIPHTSIDDNCSDFGEYHENELQMSQGLTDRIWGL